MKEDSLSGTRYIMLVRCSTKDQADTSIDDQVKVLRKFADEHHMQYVDEVRLVGVSGSRPGARHDLEDLLRRKRERDDFEVLLVQDVSRLTRSGARHASKLEYDLAVAGIMVCYATETIPDGDLGEVYKSLLHTQSKQYARALSFTTARGAMSAIQERRITYCGRPPYAIDKLYVTQDGIPRHIIRQQADGTQLMLHPETGAVLGTFGRNERTGAPAHYQKQKNEQVVLVPGAPERVAVVQQIYRWHYRERWGCPKIAGTLNEQGIPSSTGKHWHPETVRDILHNPIYGGLGIANRTTAAIYHERAPDAPRPVEVQHAILAKYARPPVRIRPRAEWIETEHEQLQELLDEDIRASAIERHHQVLETQAAGRMPKPNRDRHTQSEFFLKGILVTKQGNHPMTGRRTGTKPYRRRYYGIAKSRLLAIRDPVCRKLVPAAPIEQAVLGMLSMLLSRKDDLTRDVRALVERVARRESEPGEELAKLKRERDAAMRKVLFALEHLDDVGQDATKELTQRLETRVRTLDAEIKRLTGTTSSPLNVEQTVKRVTRDLTNLGNSIDGLSPAALRDLVAVFVSRAVVDLETRHVELELRLPEWALGLQESMCLDTKIGCQPGIEAHAGRGVVMLSPRLLWVEGLREYGAVDFAGAA